ncbi:MAG: hypothetical protein R3293_20670 [Candidatus Promineifilaceae bacterium]|nr:hypothetical protein [Candidatus Promineifilaceae bacterium]
MSTNSLDTLEDRIQKPGYLLLVVVVLLLLIVGLVDLIDYIAIDPVIFGRYTLHYFVFLVGYTLLTFAWASLLLKPNDDRLLTKTLDFIQMRPILAIGLLAIISAVTIIMINAGNTIEGTILTLPAFQVTWLVTALLFSGLIIFYKWGDDSRPQTWRKIIVAFLGLVLIIETVVQVMANFGALPADLSTTNSFDDYAPYSRIYQSTEGFGNGLTNNYGRYAPDFELLPDSYRIAVLGDSYVEGLQVNKEQNFGVMLAQHLAEDNAGEQTNEVLSLGHPDLGPGIYLSNWMLFAMVQALEPDEAIIFFDLGSDFQTVDRAGTGQPFFVYAGQGRVQQILSNFWLDLHETEHQVHRGYEGFQPVLFLQSNYLTPRLLRKYNAELIGGDRVIGQGSESSESESDPPHEFLFNEKTNKEAVRIASAQINMAREQLKREGVEVRLVTHPMFNEAFYEQSEWNTRFGDSDLLSPEHKLREAAASYGIPFLGLGAYMQALGLTPAEIQPFYFNDGRGHLTPLGHEFVANAIYQCFYGQTLSPNEGCDLN